MKWYKRDPDAARLAALKAQYGPNCCGEYPMYEHVRHFVYVVGRKDGPVKIGLCRDLGKRIHGLQTACPFVLDLFWSASMASKEIAREVEMSVLERFPRVIGEWLNTGPAPVIEFLEA
jgi:predicted GIY-YIG superfamily endonuclease